MAHVTVEWSANLASDFDLGALLRLIAETMRERADGTFPVGGIRVRGLRTDSYVIADGANPNDGFIDLRVLMGAGRSAEFRRSFFDSLFAEVRDHLGDLFDRRPVALSMYVEEAEGWKHNSIHRRLATTKAI
ncbi:5-carboxymethyl-2-hydroxymuconate Delta-isomerase [Sphingomonas sp. So64.6b]|uniref:5-carboxymethyl-2-hydroxymuconate isomerase n=1 Tax=Sphingomonas sp. So64.6b TaxID=2997354 RepID=UPI0016040341|nr:5-carboxymethyl-2-hydroxymuconate isomerase [Sphingomonas sp. So64.6b]QNA85504.1 5-carboxymethyl-2-hydroxymuconate Delta-isomerase [Sphingomonas sp. So64.6b]